MNMEEVLVFGRRKLERGNEVFDRHSGHAATVLERVRGRGGEKYVKVRWAAGGRDVTVESVDRFGGK